MHSPTVSTLFQTGEFLGKLKGLLNEWGVSLETIIDLSRTNEKWVEEELSDSVASMVSEAVKKVLRWSPIEKVRIPNIDGLEQRSGDIAVQVLEKWADQETLGPEETFEMWRVHPGYNFRIGSLKTYLEKLTGSKSSLDPRALFTFWFACQKDRHGYLGFPSGEKLTDKPLLLQDSDEVLVFPHQGPCLRILFTGDDFNLTFAGPGESTMREYAGASTYVLLQSSNQ